MEKSKLLLVDDEPNLTSALVRSLDRQQFEIFTADSAQQGLMILAGNDIDVVVSDERMPGMTGSQFLSEVRKKWPNTIRMILSGQADLEAAVRAINEGEVYRFLLKPCHPKELQMTILQGLQQKKLVAQSRRLLQEHQKTQNLLDELEKANPGITKIDVDEDGAIDMEAYGEAGNSEDVQSLLDDLEKEMLKIGQMKWRGRSARSRSPHQARAGTHAALFSVRQRRLLVTPMVARDQRAYPPPLQQDAASARFPWIRRNGFLWPPSFVLPPLRRPWRKPAGSSVTVVSKAICPAGPPAGR